MKKRRAIVKLSFIIAAIVIGIIFAVVPIPLGNTDYKSFIKSIKLGIDLKGGVYAVYEADETDLNNIAVRLDGTKERLKALLESKGGYTEATIVREGNTRLRVEVPDVSDPGKIFEIIGEPAEMQFIMDETSEIIITGDHVTNATSQYNTETGSYSIKLELNNDGASKFYAATSEQNKGKTMSIKLNDVVITTATINEPIPNGVALITGNYTKEEADSTAGKILSGAMGVKLKLIESSTISATLGQDALTLGMIAGGIGILLVMLFMAAIYKMLGVIADISLLIYVVLMLFFLSVLPWVQLTLPGLAGIILGLGMSVDANVVIYERIKDEYKSGKSITSAVHAGFKRAFSAILDSNITTLIAAIVLWILGTGPVKGFAITLFLGIILSLFTALIVTRGLIKIFLNFNKDNGKLYGLKRDAGVEEIPDEEIQPKQKKDKKKKVRNGGLIDA